MSTFTPTGMCNQCGEEVCPCAIGEISKLKKLLETLADPQAVRVNLLRGIIATPPGFVWATDTDGPVARMIREERDRLKWLVMRFAENRMHRGFHKDLAALFEPPVENGAPSPPAPGTPES